GRIRAAVDSGETVPHAAPPSNGKTRGTVGEMDDLRIGINEADYQWLRAKFLSDAGVIAALACARPELVLSVTRCKLEWNDQSLKGRIALLIHEGFFKNPRGAGDVLREAQRRGWMKKDNRSNHVAIPLGALTEEGFLVREDSGYQVAPGIKISTKEL